MKKKGVARTYPIQELTSQLRGAATVHYRLLLPYRTRSPALAFLNFSRGAGEFDFMWNPLCLNTGYEWGQNLTAGCPFEALGPKWPPGVLHILTWHSSADWGLRRTPATANLRSGRQSPFTFLSILLLCTNWNLRKTSMFCHRMDEQGNMQCSELGRKEVKFLGTLSMKSFWLGTPICLGPCAKKKMHYLRVWLC